MKNLIILILVVIIIGGGAYYYFNYYQTEDLNEGGLNMPNLERKPLDLGKDDGKNVGGKKIPDLKSNLNSGTDCNEACDNECGDKQEDCTDECQDDYDDIYEQASIDLAACNHNCQFIPIPPGPGPCLNQCQASFDDRTDKTDLNECKSDCNDKENICLEDCYNDC